MHCSLSVRMKRFAFRDSVALGFAGVRRRDRSPEPPAAPAPSSVAHSSAPAARPRLLLESVQYPRASPSGASLPSQPPWLLLIPPLAGEKSKEMGPVYSDTTVACAK